MKKKHRLSSKNRWTVKVEVGHERTEEVSRFGSLSISFHRLLRLCTMRPFHFEVLLLFMLLSLWILEAMRGRGLRINDAHVLSALFIAFEKKTF